jgi:hypothetical protein
MEKYGVRPASYIKNISGKAIKVDTGKDFKDKFDYCIGYDQDNMYVVQFGIEGENENYEKYYFPIELRHDIRAFGNQWINNPILNRSGLAAIVWNPAKEDMTPNELRRRLENKALRGTFDAYEEKAIMDAAMDLITEMKKAFNVTTYESKVKKKK